MPSQLVNQARLLRKNATPEEAKLWERLRSRKLGGFKFRRQQPIGEYIADFVCLEAHLVVELDGQPHIDAAQIIKDADRTLQLYQHGFKVIRFWNVEVRVDIEHVLESIKRECYSRPRKV